MTINNKNTNKHKKHDLPDINQEDLDATANVMANIEDTGRGQLSIVHPYTGEVTQALRLQVAKPGGRKKFQRVFAFLFTEAFQLLTDILTQSEMRVLSRVLEATVINEGFALISQQELARQMGTSQENISRSLKGLRRKGVVETGKGKSVRINPTLAWRGTPESYWTVAHGQAEETFGSAGNPLERKVNMTLKNWQDLSDKAADKRKKKTEKARQARATKPRKPDLHDMPESDTSTLH